VCASFLDTTAPVHVRFATRRLRRRFPDAAIVVGAWGLAPEAAEELCTAARSDACVTRLAEALRWCLEAATRGSQGEGEPPSTAPKAAA
jgi:hypothetical protein